MTNTVNREQAWQQVDDALGLCDEMPTTVPVVACADCGTLTPVDQGWAVPWGTRVICRACRDQRLTAKRPARVAPKPRRMARATLRRV
jgi:hypothetical protein